MAEDETSSGGDRSLGGRAAALLIDLLLLSGIIYAGRVIALSLLLYFDGLIRGLISGFAPAATISDLRAQLRSHPILLGRPALIDLIGNVLGPAAMVALYLAFLKAALDGNSPGRTLLIRAGQRIKAGLRGLLDELAGKIWQSARSWIPGSTAATDLRKRLGNLGALFAPAWALPAGSRPIGITALVMAALLTAATPLVYSFDKGLAKVAFENSYGKPALVAQVSVYLSLAAIVVGWAAALMGAALASPIVVGAIGPFYVFTFVFIGLTGGRAWWLAVPQWTLPLLAALAPSPARRWLLRAAVLWALCALAVLHSLRLTPMHGIGGLSSWRVVLPASLIAALAISRLRRRVPAGALFGLLLAVNALFIAAALRAGVTPVSANIYASLYQLAGILTLFWFILGANLVSACIGLTNSTVALAGRFFSARWLPWEAVGLCLAELFMIGELQRFNPAFMHDTRALGQSTIRLTALPAHQGVAIAILLIAAMLAAGRGLTGGRARGLIALWAFSLFLIWAFFLSGIALLSTAPGSGAPAGASIQGGFALLRAMEKRLGGEQQFAAIGILTFGLFWEAFRGPRQSEPGPSAQPSGALILYLGALALLAALTHFTLVSATMSPQAPDAYMYSGMSALWLPMALYAAFCARQQAGSVARNILLGPFFVGVLASTVVCFQRMLLGDPARTGVLPNLSVVATGEAAIFVCVLFIVSSARIARAIDAAAAGAACALGFAVGYTQGLIAPVLSQLIGVVAALTGLRAAEGFARYWLDPSRWNVVAQSEVLIFYLAAPALAGAIAVLTWKWRRHLSTGWNLAGALMAAAATVLYVAPLYRISALRFPSSAIATAAIAPAAYFGAVAYLAPPMLAFGLYVYTTAWRPAAAPDAGLAQV